MRVGPETFKRIKQEIETGMASPSIRLMFPDMVEHMQENIHYDEAEGLVEYRPKSGEERLDVNDLFRRLEVIAAAGQAPCAKDNGLWHLLESSRCDGPEPQHNMRCGLEIRGGLGEMMSRDKNPKPMCPDCSRGYKR